MIKVIRYNSLGYEEMLSLRYRILREPLGLSFSEKDIEVEKKDIFLAVYMPQTTRIIACCILTAFTNDVVILRQMAVDTDWQNQGVGKKIVLAAERFAVENGYQTISLNAREVAVGFYEKHGYKVIGDKFTEVGIPHFSMEKYIQKY